MRRPTRGLSVLPAIAALVCGLAAGAKAAAAENTKTQTVSLGIVTPLNRTRMADHFGDFVGYIAAKLASDSNFTGRVMVARTSFELARLIEQRQVDFYMESPYPTHLINNVQGVARLRLRRWKGGLSEYQSLIFTKRNGEINRLQELKGKVLAFEDPESTSGYFLPRSFLIRRGFKFTDKNRYDVYASPTDVGYLFAYSQQNLVNWVLAKKVAAAAFSDDDYARLEKKERSEITILAETERLPRHFFSVRKDFSPALTDRLEKILLSMHENAEGRRILKETDDTTKFEPLAEGDTALRRRLAEIFDSAKKNPDSL